MQSIQIVDESNNGEIKQEQIKVISIEERIKGITFQEDCEIYRHGDLVLTRLNGNNVPKIAKESFTFIECESRLMPLHTRHIIHDPLGFVAHSSRMYVVLDKPSVITHAQHANLNLPSGIYHIRHAGLPLRQIND